MADRIELIDETTTEGTTFGVAADDVGLELFVAHVTALDHEAAELEVLVVAAVVGETQAALVDVQFAVPVFGLDAEGAGHARVAEHLEHGAQRHV